MNIEILVKELKERLPELEWKLNHSHPISNAALPHDLFPRTIEFNAQELMVLLKQEIERLAQQNNPSSCYYLAQKIHRKISLLVSCLRMKETEPPNGFLQSICTRQQFVFELQKQIQNLHSHQQALELRLLKTKDPDITLELKKEIGKIEQSLTEIREKNHLLLQD